MALTTFTRLITRSTGCEKIASKIQSRLTGYGQTREYAVAGIQEKIQVGNLMINVEKVGRGSHKILCCPGTLGSIETDFAPQLQKLNREKFTIIAWDPPGYGKSRPPDRDIEKFVENFEADARIAHALMKTLGHNKFSVMGWSGGGGSAMLLAILFPESVMKLVVMSSQAFFNEKDAITSKLFDDIDKWSEKMRDSMLAIYGEEYLRKVWSGYITCLTSHLHVNVCKDKLEGVKCPTFIIHGAKDVMISPEHSEYLHKHIKNSKLYIMPEGNHNLHLRYPDEFNALVESFLLEK